MCSSLCMSHTTHMNLISLADCVLGRQVLQVSVHLHFQNRDLFSPSLVFHLTHTHVNRSIREKKWYSDSIQITFTVIIKTLRCQYKSTSNKSKNKQVGLHHTKKLLQSKGNSQQNEKAIYRTGENICKSYI